MAFTLVGYTEEQNITALGNVAAIPDPHVRVEGDDIIVPDLNNIIGYYCLGSSTTQARLSSPSLRDELEPDIEPIDYAVLEPRSDPPYHDRFDTPIPLDKAEALHFQVVQEAGVFRSWGLVWLGDGEAARLPSGPLSTVRATASVTLTPNEWTNGALTFVQTLPAGTYAIVGMRAQSAGLVAARLVIPGYSWRPGCIGFDADQDLEYRRFRYGGMGVWGEFDHNEPPTVDFLSISADTNEVVHLDVVRIG